MPDEFERLVADAREKLSAREGRGVSWREIARRAGFEENNQFSRVSYHLLPREGVRSVHHVPVWLIDALTPVFSGIVTSADLHFAAARAAGYNVARCTD